MIYIKIYLDKDENGEDMLVFDSASEKIFKVYQRIKRDYHEKGKKQSVSV